MATQAASAGQIGQVTLVLTQLPAPPRPDVIFFSLHFITIQAKTSRRKDSAAEEERPNI
jgi:hypothetical protein